jgi:hypothetical protein
MSPPYVRSRLFVAQRYAKTGPFCGPNSELCLDVVSTARVADEYAYLLTI